MRIKSVIGLIILIYLSSWRSEATIGSKEVIAEINSSVTTNVTAEGGTANVSIENNVESTSETTVRKRIEININGQKKVIESDQPGETSVQIQSSGPSVTPTIQLTETTASKTPDRQNINTRIQKFIDKLKKEIDALLNSIFSGRERT